MAILYGFGGPLDTAGHAVIHAAYGSPRVNFPTDLKVTAGGGLVVNVAKGWFFAGGGAMWFAAETYAIPSPTVSTWVAIVVEADWTAKTAVISSVQGGTTPVVPALSSSAAWGGLGTKQYPIALVQITSTGSVGTVLDARTLVNQQVAAYEKVGLPKDICKPGDMGIVLSGADAGRYFFDALSGGGYGWVPVKSGMTANNARISGLLSSTNSQVDLTRGARGFGGTVAIPNPWYTAPAFSVEVFVQVTITTLRPGGKVELHTSAGTTRKAAWVSNDGSSNTEQSLIAGPELITSADGGTVQFQPQINISGANARVVQLDSSLSFVRWRAFREDGA